MQDLDPANEELLLARKALHEMRRTGVFLLAESQWRGYLNHLERIWVKAAVACRPFGTSFRTFNAKYRAERETDRLLRYLAQARHADNHSIQQLTQPSPGLFSKWLGPRISIHVNGVNLVALSVANRGVTYPVPSSHLGGDILSNCVTDLGEQGCGYYEGYLHAVQREFFPDAP